MSRTVSLSILDRVSIASPCTASWDDMKGNDRVRHCGRCDLNVYNLAALTRREAEDLILAGEGRVCARIYKRADGTVITADCPVGLARLRQRAARMVLRAGAAVFTIFTAAFLARARTTEYAALESVEPFATLCRWARPAPPVIMGKPAMLGAICVSPPPSAPPPSGSK